MDPAMVRLNGSWLYRENDELGGDTVKVGDLVKWSWHLGTDWATTHFMGVIVGSKLYKHARYTEGWISVSCLMCWSGYWPNDSQVREDEATWS